MILNFKVNKPADLVFEYLTDVKKFVTIHPVISKIDYLGSNSYLVYETLKFGFIHFSFTYPVTIDSNYVGKRIIIKAAIMKLVKIEMNFKIESHKDFTTIYEIISIKTFLPVKFIIKYIFTKQHKQLFDNMGQLN
jgi:carbon monoxide dehydrogenase subunit G